MNAASVETHPARWTRARWLTLIALVFAAHVGFILAFGARKPVVPRAVKNVPALKLADEESEWLALNNPALFALPNSRDFASVVWSQMPDMKQPSFRWTEPPRWLPPSANELGNAFNQFMQTHRFANFQLQFKPPPKLSAPTLPIESTFAQTSTLQIQGDLAQRQLLDKINLPSLPDNDVIAPSVVQVLVNANGNVISAVLLTPENFLETTAVHNADADQRALELARSLRFAPAAQLTFGKIIFNWRTIPTNAPALSP